jgi:hypothetical protein
MYQRPHPRRRLHNKQPALFFAAIEVPVFGALVTPMASHEFPGIFYNLITYLKGFINNSREWQYYTNWTEGNSIKRILLVCLALLMMQGVCWAKIEKQVDKFDGSYAYYVNDFWREDYGQIHIDTTFNLVFSDGDTIGSPNLILYYSCYDKAYASAYAIDPTIKMRIDDTIYTWDSNSSSTRSNGSVSIVFGLPDNIYKPLINTKKDVAIRFTYHTLSGHYQKDYTIPFKTIKDVQTMYKTYYKIPSSTVDNKQATE